MSATAARRVAAIYNPTSGGGAYKRELPRIMELLRTLGLSVDERPTEAPLHATVLARDAVEQGFDIVCTIGGDGTVNETINGLAGSNVPLAIIPTGTVNVLALELGIPLCRPDACRLVAEGELSWIDPFLSTAWYWLAALINSHTNHPGVHYFRTETAQVSVVDSDAEVLVQTDGEVAGHLPMECRVVPRALRVLAP